MKTDKIVGIAAIVIGIDLVAASLLADVLGVGNPGFGAQQTVGTVSGAALTVTAVWLLRRE